MIHIFSCHGSLAPLLDLRSSCDVVSCALLSQMKWRNVGSEAIASLNSLSLILQGAAQPPWYWAEGRSVEHCRHVKTCWKRLSPLVLMAASLLVSCRHVHRSRWSLFCFTGDVKYIQNLNLKTGRRFVSCNSAVVGWWISSQWPPGFSAFLKPCGIYPVSFDFHSCCLKASVPNWPDWDSFWLVTLMQTNKNAWGIDWVNMIVIRASNFEGYLCGLGVCCLFQVLNLVTMIRKWFGR